MTVSIGKRLRYLHTHTQKLIHNSSHASTATIVHKHKTRTHTSIRPPSLVDSERQEEKGEKERE